MKPDRESVEAASARSDATGTGTVLGVSRGIATIRIDSDDECATCNHKNGCHSAVEGPTVRWPAGDAEGLTVGQRVRIAQGRPPRTLTASLVYVLPLLTLMFGAYAGSVRGGDAGAVMGAAVGLLVGALVVGTMARFGTARGWWSFSVAAAPQADDHGLIELPRPGAGR